MSCSIVRLFLDCFNRSAAFTVLMFVTLMYSFSAEREFCPSIKATSIGFRWLYWVPRL